MNKNFYLGFTCLLMLVIAGCVATSEMFVGNSVAPERVVAIQGSGPNNGFDEDFDVSIRYDFTRVGDVLKISGQVALRERYTQLYGTLTHLYTYLFFVDESSRVLETVALATAMTGDPAERLNFSRSLNVPNGAVGISFGYDGGVVEGEVRLSTSYTFYRLPLK